MLVYKDSVSDSYSPKLINDVIYEFDGKSIVVSNSLDSRLIGGNASAEAGDEGPDDKSERVIDIIHANRLKSTLFDKKTFQIYLKVFENFNDYEFFTGESMNPDGMVILMNYREDGLTPYFILIKDGLVEEKY